MFHVTLRQLQVFEAVARNLNFTRASQELHMTQPAVSMQIKQLEEQVGLALFEQLGKRNYLTAAGREMYHYSRDVLDLLEEADEVIQDLRGLRGGTLDISVATTANEFVTRMLAAFSREHESVKYRLDVTNRSSLLDQLAKNEKDLVIMGRPPSGLGLEVESFLANPLVVIAAPDNPLVEKSNIPLARLEGETFVVRERVSGTRISIERFFEEHNMKIVSSMEMTSNEAIKQAVQAGLGLGIVSIHTVRLELETGRLCVLDVEDFPIKRDWYIVHRKGKRLTPVAAAFREYVLKHASEFASWRNDLKKSGQSGA